MQTTGNSLLLYLIKQSITPPLSGRAEELEWEGETGKADKNLAENKHTTQTCKMSRVNIVMSRILKYKAFKDVVNEHLPLLQAAWCFIQIFSFTNTDSLLSFLQHHQLCHGRIADLETPL